MIKIYLDEDKNYNDIIEKYFFDSLDNYEHITLIDKNYEDISVLRHMYSMIGNINVSFVSFDERIQMYNVYKKIINVDIELIKYIKHSNYKYEIIPLNNINPNKQNINKIINSFEKIIFTKFKNFISEKEQFDFLDLLVSKAAKRNKSVMDYYNSFSKEDFLCENYSLSSASLKNIVSYNGEYFYGYLSNYNFQKWTNSFYDIALLINDLYNYNFKIESLKLYNNYKKINTHIDFYLNLVPDHVDNYWIKKICVV